MAAEVQQLKNVIKMLQSESFVCAPCDQLVCAREFPIKCKGCNQSMCNTCYKKSASLSGNNECEPNDDLEECILCTHNKKERFISKETLLKHALKQMGVKESDLKKAVKEELVEKGKLGKKRAHKSDEEEQQEVEQEEVEEEVVIPRKKFVLPKKVVQINSKAEEIPSFKPKLAPITPKLNLKPATVANTKLAALVSNNNNKPFKLAPIGKSITPVSSDTESVTKQPFKLGKIGSSTPAKTPLKQAIKKENIPLVKKPEEKCTKCKCLRFPQCITPKGAPCPECMIVSEGNDGAACHGKRIGGVMVPQYFEKCGNCGLLDDLSDEGNHVCNEIDLVDQERDD